MTANRRQPPRRVTREVPVWQRRRAATAAGRAGGQQPWVQLSGRRAERAVQAAMAAQQAIAAPAGVSRAPGARAAVIPVRAPRGPWRFRKHLQPFIWLALLLAAGAGLHAAPRALWWGMAAAAVVPGVMLLVSGQRDQDGKHIFTRWARRFVAGQAGLTSFWLAVMAVLGVRVTFPWVLLTGAPFLALWAWRYRWRPKAEAGKGPAAAGDAETFAALCEEQKWRAHLGRADDLPAGGRRYPVQCDGVKTVMKKILAVPDNVAGAWHSTVSECYAERDPKGVTSRGYLTILPGNSLQAGRFWGGKGMDPATGMVCIGRFADGAGAHMKWYTPRYGTRHDLISGTTGSGKSEVLNLYVFAALATGWFVPVICDPQEGQSLPFWRDKCLYASGVGEVQRMLRGLHAGFLDRSSYLSTLAWDDEGVAMPGMPFFDYELTGLPMPLIILDEAHMVLKDGNKEQRQITSDVVEMARLIRKAGGKMTLATQIPGLSELGGQQALRDMLRGGNVWSGRTANKVASGMVGLEKDPSELPRFFGDGSETAGLGYTSGPDNRPDAPMRTDRVGREHYKNPPPVSLLDDRFLEVMDKAMKAAVSPTSAAVPVPARSAARSGRLFSGAPLRAVPDPEPELEPDGDAPEGRRCEDAVWQVLTGSAEPLDRGEIIARAGALAAQWGRGKPWSIRQVGNVLRDMTGGKVPGRVVRQPQRGGPYQAVPAEAVPAYVQP